MPRTPNPTLLVPLDGSELSERALDIAAALARSLDGRLVLLRVPEIFGLDVDWYGGMTPEPGTPVMPLPELMDEASEETERYLAFQADKLAERGLTVETIIGDGEPADSVMATADAEDAWLIVMSTHGYGGLTRWAFGSVADKVMRHADQPLLLVRADAEHVTSDIDHILVALDGSELAERVLERVERMAGALGARVTLTYVVQQPRIAQEDERLLTAESKHIRRMEDYLARHVERLRAAGVTADYETQAGDEVAEVLIERAADPDVDLVALTTHGRGGLRRWSLGSVADRVVRAVETPVLVERLAGSE